MSTTLEAVDGLAKLIARLTRAIDDARRTRDSEHVREVLDQVTEVADAHVRTEETHVNEVMTDPSFAFEEAQAALRLLRIEIAGQLLSAHEAFHGALGEHRRRLTEAALIALKMRLATRETLERIGFVQGKLASRPTPVSS